MIKITILTFLICCFLGGPVFAAKVGGGVYGPVKQQESLWQIAKKYRQRGFSMAQLMMSIYRDNPEAFQQSNINRLKQGALLKIPDLQSVQKIGLRQANREATAHIDQFEQEVREVKVQRGELPALSRQPRTPELLPRQVAGSSLTSGIAPVQTVVTQSESIQLAQTTTTDAEAEAKAKAKADLAAAKAARNKRQHDAHRPLFRYSYDLSVLNDDNLRLAQNEEDIRSDIVTSATIKATAGMALDDFSIFNFGGRASFNKFKTFDKLDNASFDLNTRFRFAFNSGYTSPIYSIGAKLGGVEYDTEMRDATFVSVSAGLRKWITNTINMSTGWNYRQQEAKSKAFDTTKNRLFLNFDTNLSKTGLIYTTVSYTRGDIVSSATPTVDIVNAAEVIEPDDAFGGLNWNQFAYRLEADTVVLTFGINKILSRSLSVDISARYVDATAVEDDTIGYNRTLLRASLLGRF